jgi:hypothetical protein
MYEISNNYPHLFLDLSIEQFRVLLHQDEDQNEGRVQKRLGGSLAS